MKRLVMFLVVTGTMVLILNLGDPGNVVYAQEQTTAAQSNKSGHGGYGFSIPSHIHFVEPIVLPQDFKGWVAVGGPVIGADIAAYDESGNRLEGSFEPQGSKTTTVYGSFYASVRPTVPLIRFVATGGGLDGEPFDGTLM